MRHLPHGSWMFSWCEHEIDGPPWELKLELIADSTNRWGYLALIRMSNDDPLGLDLNTIDRRVLQLRF